MSTPRRMHLVAYLKTGPTANHPGAWRHPEADLDDIFEPTRYEHIARVLEAACFDACFFADLLGLYDIHGGSFETYVRDGGQISYLDPLTVLPIMLRTFVPVKLSRMPPPLVLVAVLLRMVLSVTLIVALLSA